MANYTTATNVKEYLGISGTADDKLIQSLIDSACAAIDHHTHRTFAVTSDSTRYFDAVQDVEQGTRTLWLDEDLCQITSVVTDADGSAITLTTSDYTTQPRNETPYHAIRIKASSAYQWTWSEDPADAITVTGRWGYSATPPTDIQQAAVRLTAFYYKQKDNPLFDVTTVEAGVVISPQGVPNDIKLMLAPYVRR